MSANPEAFEGVCVALRAWLRLKRISAAAAPIGEMEGFCRSWLEERFADRDDEVNIVSMARRVADWHRRFYRPRGRRVAKRDRERRAWDRRSIELYRELVSPDASIRAIADSLGASKSRVQRVLAATGDARRRQRRIDETLSPRGQQVLGLIEASLRGQDATAVFAFDALEAAMWPCTGPESRSARSMRRRRLREALSDISLANLGLHILLCRDRVAVRRGRRWARMKDALYAVQELPLQRVIIPKAPRREDLLFESREAETLLAYLRMSLVEEVDGREAADLFWICCRRPVRLLDPEPFDRLLCWVLKQYETERIDQMCGVYLARHPDLEPRARKAIKDVGELMYRLIIDRRCGATTGQLLRRVWVNSGYRRDLDLLRHDEGRPAWLRAHAILALAEQFPDAGEFLDEVGRLRKLEAAGRWRADELIDRAEVALMDYDEPACSPDENEIFESDQWFADSLSRFAYHRNTSEAKKAAEARCAASYARQPSSSRSLEDSLGGQLLAAS